jgi:ABC-2 type transport system permease protein
MRAIWAMLLRDLRHEASYKLAFLMQLLGSFHVFLIFLFLSRMFTGLPIQSLQNYGGSYFPFVLTGIAVQHYLYLALNTFSGQLREAQMMGTLEAVLVCPVPLPLFLAGSLLFSFVLNTFHIAIFLLAGALIGAFPLSVGQLPQLALVLGLSAGTFSSIGVLTASYCVVFKKGNPIAWFLTLSSSLLGGVYFPTSVLPHWLQIASAWVPMTHCLEALRGTLIQGKGLLGIEGSLIVLGIWAVVGLPLSGLTFMWAVSRGRHTGSLGHY